MRVVFSPTCSTVPVIVSTTIASPITNGLSSTIDREANRSPEDVLDGEGDRDTGDTESGNERRDVESEIVQCQQQHDRPEEDLSDETEGRQGRGARPVLIHLLLRVARAIPYTISPFPQIAPWSSRIRMIAVLMNSCTSCVRWIVCEAAKIAMAMRKERRVRPSRSTIRSSISVAVVAANLCRRWTMMRFAIAEDDRGDDDDRAVRSPRYGRYCRNTFRRAYQISMATPGCQDGDLLPHGLGQVCFQFFRGAGQGRDMSRSASR